MVSESHVTLPNPSTGSSPNQEGNIFWLDGWMSAQRNISSLGLGGGMCNHCPFTVSSGD